MLKTSESTVRAIERKVLAAGWKIWWDSKTRAWYVSDKGGCCFVTAGSAASMRESLLDFVEASVDQALTRGHDESSD